MYKNEVFFYIVFLVKLNTFATLISERVKLYLIQRKQLNISLLEKEFYFHPGTNFSMEGMDGKQKRISIFITFSVILPIIMSF